ncbi:hypothetical protein [Pararhizobium sp.]|uniref:hypothetical protein n=1 Tax=Pararhizobium sp. TaxID=1977563 RepID=UPI0027275EA0|nr:hypothetical protein [Pararhizobium sp.]MDO9417679.1 hypothetical protein [Pararhizobium sp.]
MGWGPYDDGSSLGTAGSEGGIILRDEEHAQGARITLEDSPRPPFAITCGIYGVMVHTAYAATQAEAETAYGAMKADLEMLLDLWPDATSGQEAENRYYDAVSAFTDTY